MYLHEKFTDRGIYVCILKISFFTFLDASSHDEFFSEECAMSQDVGGTGAFICISFINKTKKHEHYKKL